MTEKIFFFFGNTKIEVSKPSLTGAEIKAAIKSQVSDFNPDHDLVLQGAGHDADSVVKDDDVIDLAHGHGGGPKHFFSRPPTNFGAY